MKRLEARVSQKTYKAIAKIAKDNNTPICDTADTLLRAGLQATKI